MPSSPLSIWGIGPRLALVGAITLVLGWGLSLWWPQADGLFPESRLLRLGGGLWCAIGLYFWLDGALRVLSHVPRGRLITSGVFRCCRNPMYASFIVFLLPGMALLWNTWLPLAVSCVMGMSFSHLIHHEEQALERLFGDEYREYCRRVPPLIPWLFWGRGDGERR